MYNAKYVIPGLIIFLLLALSPMIYNSGAATAELPATKLTQHPYPTSMPIDEWKANHMRYVNADSIANCKGCHGDPAKFCDKCHDYVGVSPSILQS